MTKVWETIARSVSSRIWTMEKEGVGTITTFRISDPNRAIGGSRHHTIAEFDGLNCEKPGFLIQHPPKPANIQ